MKKLINKVVSELVSLGLQPSVLQELLKQGEISALESSHTVPLSESAVPSELLAQFPRVVYEFSSDLNSIEPQLRLWVKGDHARALGLSRLSQLPSADLRTKLNIVQSPEDAASQTQVISPKFVCLVLLSTNY